MFIFAWLSRARKKGTSIVRSTYYDPIFFSSVRISRSRLSLCYDYESRGKRYERLIEYFDWIGEKMI